MTLIPSMAGSGSTTGRGCMSREISTLRNISTTINRNFKGKPHPASKSAESRSHLVPIDVSSGPDPAVFPPAGRLRHCVAVWDKNHNRPMDYGDNPELCAGIF